jgi:hypothetical protein
MQLKEIVWTKHITLFIIQFTRFQSENLIYRFKFTSDICHESLQPYLGYIHGIHECTEGRLQIAAIFNQIL